MSRDRSALDLEILNRVMRTLLRGGDYDHLLDDIMGELIAALGAERGYLVGRDPLDIKSVRNWSREEISAQGGEVSRSIVRDVLEKNQPILLQDALQSPYGKFQSVQKLQLASVIAAPIPRPDGAAAHGVLYLEARASIAKFTPHDLALVEEVLELSGRALEGVLERERARALESALLARHRFPGIVTGEPAMLAVLQTVAQVATSEVPVMILGESGTGKELIARALHLNSGRSGKFIAINCGAFTSDLLESELFGHRAGAFTGAHADRAGLMQAAAGGTLFLDEVADMPMHLQVKLLRAAQFGELKPIGSDETVRVDVRFVSATNKDPEHEVEAGRFRQDLLYRLNTITVELPPLRERVDDILLLVRHFIEAHAERAKLPAPPEVTRELDEALIRHRWPGNVRELENEVARMMAISGGRRPLTPDLLSRRILEDVAPSEDPRHLSARLDAEEKRAIMEALEKDGNNRTHAAKRLGVSRETLRVKMHKHGLC